MNPRGFEWVQVGDDESNDDIDYDELECEHMNCGKRGSSESTHLTPQGRARGIRMQMDYDEFDNDYDWLLTRGDGEDNGSYGVDKFPRRHKWRPIGARNNRFTRKSIGCGCKE